ncbi:MAG: hypothetical protein JWM89_96 [Acidimicrobiales bacterium]|nr:hypothetical protein [Acidimicrobiales bacterium]
MSDSQIPSPSTSPGGEQELEVDLASFLPDGVTLAEADDRPPVDTAALEQIETDLAAVDAALAALDAGTYGRCTTCDEPVDDALLAVDPTHLTCAAH